MSIRHLFLTKRSTPPLGLRKLFLFCLHVFLSLDDELLTDPAAGNIQELAGSPSSLLPALRGASLVDVAQLARPLLPTVPRQMRGQRGASHRRKPGDIQVCKAACKSGCS